MDEVVNVRFIARIALLCGLLPLAVATAAGQESTDTVQVLSTGIAGRLSASGLESPTYVLAFPGIQRLMLAAASGPLEPGQVADGLKGTPVRLEDLLRLHLLREVDGRYRLDYLVLTVQDQLTLYRVARQFGESLAAAIRARGDTLNRLLAAYPHDELRDPLKFALIAGMVLNWEGLKLSTNLGYRATPLEFPNGDRYLVHSNERGARLELEGLYLGSEGWPGRAATLTTFGDPASFPRNRGLPNTLDPIFDALESFRGAPDLFAATRQQLLTYLSISIGDLGDLMLLLRAGPATPAELAREVDLPAERLDASLRLLLATGYVGENAGTLRISVPVLSTADRPLVDATLNLGRDVLRQWLSRNNGPLRDALADLTPLKNGLPFNLVFGEAWHYVFGFATKSLADSDFYVNPRAPGWPYPGYVPLVWATTLYDF